MIATAVLAASSLLLAVPATLADSNPFSQVINDANLILATATGDAAEQLQAIGSWVATETAIPSAVIEAQYSSYLNAYITTTNAPLPPWVTALPDSLQPAMISFLQQEASLVMQEIAPAASQMSQDGVSFSAAQVIATPVSSLSNGANVLTTPAPTATASSGFAIGIMNATLSRMADNGTATTLSTDGGMSHNGTATTISTNGGIMTAPPIVTDSATPTRPVTPPITTVARGNGAEKKEGVALVAAVIGLMGMMVLL